MRMFMLDSFYEQYSCTAPLMLHELFGVVTLQSESVLTMNDLQIKAAMKQFQEAVVQDETLKHAAAALSSTS